MQVSLCTWDCQSASLPSSASLKRLTFPQERDEGSSRIYANIGYVPRLSRLWSFLRRAQLMLLLVETGQTLPALPKPALPLLQRVVLPLAKLMGYTASYPEYTSGKA